MYVKLRGIYILLLVLLGFYAIYTQTFVVRSDSPGSDFWCYWKAACHVAAGDSPFTDAYAGHLYYLYTPTLAILMVPFSFISFEGGYILWVVISIFCYVSGAFLCGYCVY